MMLRFLSLSLILMGALMLPWWAVVPLMVPYTARYQGYELIAAMVLVDGYYGAFSQVPLLTISTILVVYSMGYVRPRVRRPEKLL